MVKSQLIQKLCNLHPNFLHKDLEKTVDIVFKEITDNLASGARIELRSFGTFKVKIRRARKARNPKTGEKIIINEKKVPSFKMSSQLKEAINKI